MSDIKRVETVAGGIFESQLTLDVRCNPSVSHQVKQLVEKKTWVPLSSTSLYALKIKRQLQEQSDV